MLEVVIIMLRLSAPFIALLVALLEPLLFLGFLLVLIVVVPMLPLYFYYKALISYRTLRF